MSRIQDIRIPALPTRPWWSSESVSGLGSASALQALNSLSMQWNQWTNDTEAIFRAMYKYVDDLDLPDEDLIGIIQLFSKFPERPLTGLGKTFEERPGDTDTDFSDPLWDLHMKWDDFADELQTLHDNFAKKISHHKVRDDRNLNFNDLSLTGRSTRSYGMSILGSMLGVGQSSRESTTHERELSTGYPKRSDLEQHLRLFEMNLQTKREEKAPRTARTSTTSHNVDDLKMRDLSVWDPGRGQWEGIAPQDTQGLSVWDPNTESWDEL